MKYTHHPFFSIFFLITLTILGSSGYSQTSLRPLKLTCEYKENPLGIDITHPRLCWTLTAEKRNEFQSAYEVIVSNNAKDINQGKGNIWTTAKIISPQNLHIEYAGESLKPFTRYYWRVKVYDNTGKVSAWSAPATFETSILRASDWIAQWIGDNRKQFGKDEDFYGDDPMPLFRKQFTITKKIASARLYISGVGYYEAYLGDEKIGDHVLDPGFTAYSKQVLYATYDITRLLSKKNTTKTLGVMLGNGWYNPLPLRLFGRFNLRDVQQTGRPCVKAQIFIRYTDGSTDIIASNDSWQTAKGPVLRNNVYLGERYDARLEKSFISKEGWNNARVVEGPGGKLSAQMQPPIRVTNIVKPIAISEKGKDTFIVDMGQNFAGVARIRVNGPEGARIIMRYGEDTFATGSLNYMTTVAGHIKEIWNLKGGPGAPKTAWQQDDYILKGGAEEKWNSRFTFHGFRYIEITGWPGKPALGDIEGLRMNTDLEQNGAFLCSNELFNKLHDVIQWTFLSNIFSVQSDCPAREKMGYGADIVVTAEAYMQNYDMGHFYSKTIQDFANDQQPDGGITEIAPYTGIADRGYGGQSGPLGWQLAFPFLQKQLYDYYGDIRIIALHYNSVKKQMDFLQAKAIEGLFHWDIGDHEAIDPRAEAFSASCFYYHHALLAAEFASILNRKEDSLKYTELAKKIKQAIVKKYWVPETGRFDNATQAAQVFALWYGLTPDKKASFQILLDELQRHNWHLSTGIFSTKMFFDVLKANDRNDIAFKVANQRTYPGWGYMLEKRATTLWESWEYPTQNSMNHPMFGSIEEWFYKSILGINSAAPGFRKITIKPQPGELAWAKGSYQSINGLIESDWKKNPEGFSFRVSIPANTTAEIWLPTDSNHVITENSKPIEQVSEIKLLRREKEYAIFAVGSGRYLFHSAIK